MSKQKSCYICGGLVETMYYGNAGSLGWMCEDCVVAMQDRFKRIFGVQVFGTTAGSDLSISLEDLSKVLGMIRRNISMLRYEIDDQDRCVSGGASDEQEG